jgi:hypothetical protein
MAGIVKDCALYGALTLAVWFVGFFLLEACRSALAYKPRWSIAFSGVEV